MSSSNFFTLDDSFIALEQWLDIQHPLQSRRFLEQQPALLTPQCGAIIEQIVQDFKEDPDVIGQLLAASTEQAQGAIERLQLLLDIHRRGRTRQAIREAYVDLYGGVALDLPSWLHMAIVPLMGMFAMGPSEQGSAISRDGLRRIIARAKDDSAIPPEMLAELHFFLEDVLRATAAANTPEVQQERLTCLQTAMSIYTRERYPRHYADIQHHLGLLYKQRSEGDQRENLNEAIACFRRALEIHTAEDFPEDHAMDQYNLGSILALAHLQRSDMQLQDILDEAIACFEDALHYYTRDDFPAQHADILRSLGMAYSDYKEGERYGHLERARSYLKRALEIFAFEQYPIKYAQVHYLLALLQKERIEYDRTEELEEALHSCMCALRVYTLETLPDNYASMQNLMGGLYMRRMTGARIANIEEALACYMRALQVYTLQHDPVEHAETLNLLGNAYRERLTGERRENLERAMIYYRRALDVFTQQTLERGIAKLHYNLAGVYSELLTGKHADNLEQAIKHCQQALEIYTRERFPVDYAQGVSMLGSLYKERIYGARSSNIEKAIAYSHEALEIYTLARAPRSYAETQHNLGNAYADRIEGEQRENLEEAIRCYERALQVFTTADFPVQHAMTSAQLGITYRERIAGDRRTNQEKALACFERALRTFTSETTPVDYARTHHNLANLYAERIAGTRQENLEKAIYHYNEALRIFTPDSFPRDYAMAQDSLGAVYSQRIAGDRRTNLEEALAYHQRALQVFTRDAFPLEYGRTMLNLGTTYTRRVAGERQNNLQEAVACYKAALELLTPEVAPTEYVNAQSNLGAVYLSLVTEEQRYRVERAIECFEDALRIVTLANNPSVYAALQQNLGYAYTERVMGERRDNVERAIACYKESLKVLTLERSALDYAKAQNQLGACYVERLAGMRDENVEQALHCFHEALSALQMDPTAPTYAAVLSNLGTAYSIRRQGDRRANLEQALAYHQQALAFYPADVYPRDYASSQLNLGNAYARRIEGNKQANLQEARACYGRALSVLTLDAFPQQYRNVQMNLAIVEASQQHWLEAHAAYKAAMEADDWLIKLGTGIIGKDSILEAGKNAALDNGYALTRLGRVAEAAVSIERGRAHGVAEALALNEADPQNIDDLQFRENYEQARTNFISLQAILNTMSSRNFDIDRMLPNQWPGTGEDHNRRMDIIFTEEYRKARERFESVLREVQEKKSGFLQSGISHEDILAAAEQCGPGHAIVYLAISSWDGIAIAAMSSDPATNIEARFAFLDLPELTQEQMDDLVETHLHVEGWPVSQSFAAAQADMGFQLFLHGWQGATFRERAMALHTACETLAESSTFDQAAQKMLGLPWLVEAIDMPYEEMPDRFFRLLAHTMGHLLLRYELRYCLDRLASIALRPLATWLQEAGVRSCTLVPCGPLAAFPLLAAEIVPGKTMADLFVAGAGVAPSARSLLRKQEREQQRSGVYALGDPQPTRQKLEWAEAEAFAIKKLAQFHGLPAARAIGKQGTRDWLVEALEKGLIVDACCHGSFDVASPMDSALRLAQRTYLPLYELLGHEVDMRGLRLLILSACQTAILDLRGAVNEVHSLAVGMLQAGARAVLAALWPVDDLATYLLMVHFMQEWLPHMKQEPPAAALARAQHWLRTASVRTLQSWYADQAPVSTPEERSEAGLQEAERRPEAEDFFWYARGMMGAVQRGTRYEAGAADEYIRTAMRSVAKQPVDPDACPFADPIYWAGFQVIGW